MSDKLDMIYDLLKSDREDASEFRKEVRDSHKSTGERLGKLEASSEVQNQQLKEHMKRSDMLEDLHGINSGRIDSHDDAIAELEKPKIVLTTLKKWTLGLGAIAGAVLAIAKLLGMF